MITINKYKKKEIKYNQMQNINMTARDKNRARTPIENSPYAKKGKIYFKKHINIKIQKLVRYFYFR